MERAILPALPVSVRNARQIDWGGQGLPPYKMDLSPWLSVFSVVKSVFLSGLVLFHERIADGQRLGHFGEFGHGGKEF